MSGVCHITVAADEGNQRLDRWFRRRFSHVTQGMVEKLLRRGEIRVDGGRVRASVRLMAGQVVRVPPLPEAPAAPRQVDPVPAGDAVAALRAAVVYFDDDIVVINKPPGLAVQGGSGQSLHLDALAHAMLPGNPQPPRLVHRLDRDTSGLIMLALSREIAARLTRAFRTRAVVKTYHAAVAGRPNPACGCIDLPILKAQDGVGRERMRCLAPGEVAPGALAAQTRYATIATAGRRAAWLTLRPVSGRTHQLRVHLAALDCPILGDSKYGGRGRANPGRRLGAGAGPALSRKLHLHAAALALEHPRTGRALRLQAPLPAHMRATWAFFEWDADAMSDDPFAEP